MALNDKNSQIVGAKGVDVYPGVANPTASSTMSNPLASNFVEDPTTDVAGAGVGADFAGGQAARKAMRPAAGVVEGRPGIIESSNIDPLNENSNKEDGWANATSQPTGTSMTGNVAQTTQGYIAGAANVATGAAKLAYGTVAGNQETAQQGKDAVFGRSAGSGGSF